MPGEVHLLPAPAAFPACVQCEVWDRGSCSWLVWVSSQKLEHGGVTACERANTVQLHQCLPTPEAPRDRMVAICFVCSEGWWSWACQEIVEHVRGNRGGVKVDWKEEAVCSRTWS